MKRPSRKKRANGRSDEIFLVADFGGTNARAALTRLASGGVEIHHLESGALRKGQTPAAWLAAYFRRRGKPAIAACAACAAGPVKGKPDAASVHFTNRDSELHAAQLAEACGLPRAMLVNDFAAVAHAIPALRRRELKSIGGGPDVEGDPDAPQLAVGPGTGLGVALRVPVGDGAVVVPAEGGHAGLAPFDRETLALWPILAERHGGQLSAEDVLCGPGLERLYWACAAAAGDEPEAGLRAAQISERGLTGEDAVCRQAVAVFTRWLGNYAGGLALVAGARGGVYLAGGILPTWGRRFNTRAFRAAFDQQVAMAAYVRAIPIHLMTHPEPAVAGLTAVADMALRDRFPT